MKKNLDYRYKKYSRGRLFAVFIVLISCLTGLAARLLYIQVARHQYYRDIAENNRNVVVTLPPKRGVIFDRNLRELVINVPRYSLYAAPRFITDKSGTAGFLSSVLGLSKEGILERISNDKLFVWISRKLPDEAARKIKAENLPGIDFVPESERSYPNNELASHILGFVDIDNNGLEGIEKYYDGELKGKEGYKVAVLDAKRRQVSSVEDHYLPPRDGYNVVLTIDETVQHIAERALEAGVKKHNPKSASVVVMNASTGDILALSNWPSYDLNKRGESTVEAMRNRAVTDMLEPGSSFKIVTASAALEEKLISLNDEFYCENGRYYVGGRILHDHKPYGTLKFKDVIVKSSNIGTVKAAEVLGEERLYKYITKFGFGGKTDVDMPGEASGIVREVSKWSKCSISSVPIGQEIAVTVLQMAAAISCIANDGILMRPRVVKGLLDQNRENIREFEPEFIRRVISKETALKVKDVLKMVVESGTGKMASIDGYSSAGKTGTAQRVEENGAYSKTKYNAIFVGFAPVDEPELAIAVAFVEPQPFHYGGTVAAPVFADIAGNTLRYMGVRPDLN